VRLWLWLWLCGCGCGCGCEAVAAAVRLWNCGTVELWNCGTVILWDAMKNITVSVSEDVYRAARVHAAEQGTSLSRLVAEYLGSLAQGGGDFERLAAQQQRIQAEVESFSAGERLGREGVHARAIR
jgi:Family of unknown function (DUF6364)